MSKKNRNNNSAPADTTKVVEETLNPAPAPDETPAEPKVKFKTKELVVTPRMGSLTAFASELPTAPSPKKRRSSWYGRVLCHEIAGESADHLQQNVDRIRQFVNSEWSLTGNRQIVDTTVHLGNISFFTPLKKVTFDIRDGADSGAILDSLRDLTAEPV